MRRQLLTMDSGRRAQALVLLLSYMTQVTLNSPSFWKFISMVLQASIQQWHMQPYPHALREAPIVLFFQLKRWSQKDSHRPVNKDLAPFSFEVGATFDLPLFESARGLQVKWLKYRLVTVLLHTGLHPWAGHYRSILSGCRQLPNGNAKWTAMLTDDDRAIRPCTAADLQHAFSNCYLLGLCREA